MEERLPRKLAAILYADVAGYSRLTGEDEDATHRRLREYLDLIAKTIEDHHGQVMHYAGDAVLAKFDAVVDALSSAVSIQNELETRNEDLPNERKVQFRIGVNLGDVIEDRGDIYGDGVNVAARLESLADPGGICISESVRTAIGKKLEPDYEFMGEQQVKNIEEPVRAYRVLLDGADAKSETTLKKPALQLPDKPSIAVLPFSNMSGDPEQEYFSDGITEDIITELSRFRNIFVISRNSSFTFKGQAVDVKEVGQKLSVNHVVEGSVRKAGNRVRVTAQLVEVASGNHVWAERYDRNLEDIFAVQDEVVSSVVAKLGLNLREAATAYARGRPTDSLTAYDHFLRGRAAWWRGDWNEGFGHLDRALAADPEFAAAHAWLALQYAYQTYSGTMGFSHEEIADKTREHAETALALDDRDPFVHMAASMAFGFSPRPDKDRGLHHSDVSVTLNPHDFDIMFCRAYNVSFFGRHQEALEWLERARDLNPVSTYMLSECYADTHYMMGNYDKVLESYKGQADVPAHVQVVFAACYAQLGREEEAYACMADMERTRPASFDLAAFIKAQIGCCARTEDAEHWREGFRKAGIAV